MDACSWDVICSQPAFWIGLLYNETSFDKAQDLVEGWTNDDRSYINKIAPKEGLQAKFKQTILDIAQKLFEISKQGLDNRNILAINKKYNETFYLKELEINLSSGQSPADILVDKFNTKWDKDINKVYSGKYFLMQKQIAIQMDNIETIDFEFDTSFLIGYEAQLRNYKIFYYNPNDLIIQNGDVQAAVNM